MSAEAEARTRELSLRTVAGEAEAILAALRKSQPVRRTEGQGVWTFSEEHIRDVHDRLRAALSRYA